MNKQELIHKWECACESAGFYGRTTEDERLVVYFQEFVEDLNQLDEPKKINFNDLHSENKELIKEKLGSYGLVVTEKPMIPQFIADWIEKCKDGDYNLFGVFDYAEGEVKDWIFNEGIKNKKINLVARAWLDGYAIEPPKTLQVIVKNYDSTVYKTELPEDEVMKLIEGWKEDEKS